MLKPISEINELADNSTDIFESNIIDYYRARPSSIQFMSLYNFASWYKRCSATSSTNYNKNRSKLERISIDKYNILMQKRKQACVIRYPKFCLVSDDYYYSLLMLLLPHRNESDLITPHDFAKDAFIAKKSLLNVTSDNMHFSFLTDVENSIRRIQLAENELNACNNYSDTNFNVNTSVSEDTFDYSELLNKDNSLFEIHTSTHDLNDTSTDFYHQLLTSEYSEEMFESRYKSLSFSQKRVFKYVQTHLKKQVLICVYYFS